MDKKEKLKLSESDICDLFITPAIKASNWDPFAQIRREVTLTPGPVIVRGNLSSRNKKKKKFADYVLSWKPSLPIAVVEAKDNNFSISQGLQQALGYAEILDVPSAFSSNGDGFASHNKSAAAGKDILLSPAILYAVSNNGGASERSALRLSLGLTLSVGPSLPARYTIVLRRSGRSCAVLENDDLVLKGRKPFTLIALPKWALSHLPILAEGVVEACEKFKVRPEVKSALQALADGRRQELANLDNLYRRRAGSNDRLLGLPELDTDGSLAIEAELREKQRLVLERYGVQIRFHLLSLGIIGNSDGSA